MYSKEEKTRDLKALVTHIESLEEKYDDTGFILSAVIKVDEEYCASQVYVSGDDLSIHNGMHRLLGCPRFVDEFFDAVCCSLHSDSNPISSFMIGMAQSLKKFFMLRFLKKRKVEDDIDSVVNNLLDDFYAKQG